MPNREQRKSGAIRKLEKPARGANDARQIMQTFEFFNAFMLYRIYRVLRMIERNMIGRYAGSMMDKLAHTLPVYLSSSQYPSGRRHAHVEIGTMFGGSLISKLVVLKKIHKNHQVIGIDPLESYYGKSVDPVTGLQIDEHTVWQNVRSFGLPKDQAYLVKHLSSNPAVVNKISDWQVLTLFIDGDHSYEGVKSDWLNFSPLVEAGGYVIFDDYDEPAWPAVTRFVDELIESLSGEWKLLGVLDTTLILQRQKVN